MTSDILKSVLLQAVIFVFWDEATKPPVIVSNMSNICGSTSFQLVDTLLWSNRGSPDIALHNSVNDSTSPPYPSDLFNMSIGSWIAPAQSRLSVNIPAYDIVLIRSLASVSSYCIFPETNLVRAGFNPSVHSINPWYKWCKGSTLHQL